MRTEALGVMCGITFVLLPITLLIGAVILRAGVSFGNRSVPKPVDPYDDYEDEDDEWAEWADYDRPKSRSSAGAIPEPGLGKAMGIVFVSAIAQSFAYVPLALIGDDLEGDAEVAFLALLVVLPIAFLIAAGVRAGMLPTTFGRACVVVVFECLVVVAIGLVIGVPLSILISALR